MPAAHLYPKHLQKIIVPDPDSSAHDRLLHGKLHCTCGGNHFSIKTFASPLENKFLRVKEYKGNFSLCITAECAECKKEWLIFDYAKHGYDALMGSLTKRVSPDTPLEPWNCPMCKNSLFEMEITLETEDREEFAETIAEEDLDLTIDDCIEAFGWITVGLTCTGCTQKTENWLDLETS